MTTENKDIDQLMERASTALARMDYLACEALCVRALRGARRSVDWGYYGRILLPLQEARRQHRMLAAAGTIRLGSAGLEGSIEDWVDRLAPGCMVLTHPHLAQDAESLSRTLVEQKKFGMVLYADNAVDADRWNIRAFAGGLGGAGDPGVCPVDAPHGEWVDRWIPPGASAGIRGPADWFLDACEALGDAAISWVQKPVGDPDRIAELERCLLATPDHEILHQTLAAAAAAIKVQR